VKLEKPLTAKTPGTQKIVSGNDVKTQKNRAKGATKGSGVWSWGLAAPASLPVGLAFQPVSVMAR